MSETTTDLVDINSEKKNKAGVLSVFVKIFNGFRYMPNKMIRVTLLYFLSWSDFWFETQIDLTIFQVRIFSIHDIYYGLLWDECISR